MTKRATVLVLAAIGCAISIRLGAFQLGIATPPPEPFFGSGTTTVLTSSVSRALPVPDAVLGAAAYVIEAALCVTGGTARWLERPWLVLSYGALAISMAITALVLIAMQALVIHAWCTLCLGSAAISLAIVGPAASEAAASLHHLLEKRQHERERHA